MHCNFSDESSSDPGSPVRTSSRLESRKETQKGKQTKPAKSKQQPQSKQASTSRQPARQQETSNSRQSSRQQQQETSRSSRPSRQQQDVSSGEEWSQESSSSRRNDRSARPGGQQQQARKNSRKNEFPKHIREIARLQQTTHTLIPKAPFSRNVREVIQRHGDLRMTADSLVALHEATEIYLVGLFEDAFKLTLHRKRVTVNPADITLALYIRGPSDPGSR